MGAYLNERCHCLAHNWCCYSCHIQPNPLSPTSLCHSNKHNNIAHLLNFCLAQAKTELHCAPSSYASIIKYLRYKKKRNLLLTLVSVFISLHRHYQRRRNNGHQWRDCFWSRYDVLGERASGGAITQHDDAVSCVIPLSSCPYLSLSPSLSVRDSACQLSVSHTFRKHLLTWIQVKCRTPNSLACTPCPAFLFLLTIHTMPLSNFDMVAHCLNRYSD